VLKARDIQHKHIWYALRGVRDLLQEDYL